MRPGGPAARRSAGRGLVAPGRALDQTFDTFRLDDLSAPAREARNAAAEFAAHPHGWLVIHGPKGNGKTHLAAAVANYLADVRSMLALFVTVPDLLRRLRLEVQASAEGRDPPAGPLLETVWGAPVLILDDLGAQKWTEFAEEQLFLLLDHRSRDKLPTMVVTNEALEALPGRIASRLADRTLSRVVLNPAPDYRWGDGRVTV